MPLKLIIFDLDGTLVDTSRDITNALNYALKETGGRDLSVEETKKVVGEGITRLIEKLAGSSSIQTRDYITKRFVQYYSEHLVDYSNIYPGVTEALEKLKSFKKVVISNKRELLSVKILDRLDLLKYFILVAGSDTAPEKKPSPVPVYFVLNKLNVKPEEALIVGDSTFDIEAGRNAGVKTVAVTYGFRAREELTAADYIIDDLRDLSSLT